MKTIRFFAVSLCLLLVCVVNLQAQTETMKFEEISLHYGRVSLPATAMTFGSVLGIVFTGGHAKPDEMSTSGAIGVEYFHYFNQKLAVGGSAVFENFRLKWNTSDETEDNIFISAMPAIKFRWLYRPHFGMYSKACIGVMIQPDPGSVSFNFQASPLGLEAGSEKVRGFAELGFGSQGLFLAGIRFTL